MTQPIRHWTVVLAVVVLFLTMAPCGLAQQSSASQAAATAEPSNLPQPQPFSAAQLDQMTAPIALYPDSLLGIILTAATYPLEIVEAARWLDQNDHASLTGSALDAALAQQDWDKSVKSLVEVPEVLRMMNDNIEWAEQLGNAFLVQQADVMDSVQRLRQRALASGKLRSSPQESVSDEDDEVVIEPTTTDVLYIPCYTPVIYGPWPWPAYPPFYFPPTLDYCYPSPMITFGIGFPIFGPYWGWGRWKWRGHGFYVVPPGHPGGLSPRPWTHNPLHRRGVPYRDLGTARRFLGPNAGT